MSGGQSDFVPGDCCGALPRLRGRGEQRVVLQMTPDCLRSMAASRQIVIAAIVAFVAGPEACYITGANLTVGGGMNA